MERLFVIISRINSVILLLILLGTGIFLVWVLWSGHQWQDRGAIEVPAEKSASKSPVLLRFERIENINGTTFK